MATIDGRCLEAISLNRCDECNNYFSCCLADVVEDRCKTAKTEGLAEAKRKLRSLWDNYMDDSDKFPKPDFVSAYATVDLLHAFTEEGT